MKTAFGPKPKEAICPAPEKKAIASRLGGPKMEPKYLLITSVSCLEIILLRKFLALLEFTRDGDSFKKTADITSYGIVTSKDFSKKLSNE